MSTSSTDEYQLPALFAGSLKGQRPEVIRKFLVDNAKQIVPNL
jgi:hypothetical protein